MKLAFGTDEVTPVTEEVVGELRRLGHDVAVVAEDMPWAETGTAVGQMVASGEAEAGVVFCFTGTGVSMAANKVPGARAALCVDPETARGARKWNDANVLALSLRLTTADMALDILAIFLGTSFDPAEAGQVALLAPRAEVTEISSS